MRPGTTLYFIRHGQTGWNKARRIQGQIDSELNDKGREQAARNGRTLRAMGLDLNDLDYVASPLSRTAETMRIVREHAGLPKEHYRTDERLKEIHFGSWQGDYWPEIPEKYPADQKRREADPYHWRPTNGESYADLNARCSAWFDELKHDTVCVSHGGVSRVLRGHVSPELDRADVTELRVPQDEILVFRHNGSSITFEWK